jgi:subtilisin family serine protease
VFSQFYREAIQAVDADSHQVRRDFVNAIQIHLAAGYFDALHEYVADPDRAPRCWRLLFDRSVDPEVTPEYFAALGVNTLVNFGLAEALLATWTNVGGSPNSEFRFDYDRLVGVVAASFDAFTRKRSAESRADVYLDRLGDVVVRSVRSLAWDEAERVWTSASRSADADASRRMLDLRAEVTGLGLLAIATDPERTEGVNDPDGEPSQDTSVLTPAPSPPGFHPRELYGSRVAIPLLERMRDEPTGGESPRPLHRVVIDLALDHPSGQEAAARDVWEMVKQVATAGNRAPIPGEGLDEERSGKLNQYVVARLTAESVRELVALDQERAAEGKGRSIFRIWPDFSIRPLINKSSATVKADAARASFAATGLDIVWAVVDSGIDASHPHFATHSTLDVTAPVEHIDYTGGKLPLTDAYGHGTHVAGILAGEMRGAPSRPIVAVRAELDSHGDVDYRTVPVEVMAGMAPACRLVSFKVLGDDGDGDVSAIITALQDIQRSNNYGRDIKIHGVNLSVGYPFDPKWFACGESPICVEVNRLAQSGVVVVVAAGNTGYGYNQDLNQGAVSAGMDLTINDPGNTELAITVGSTHRDAPYRYGVSYFSSKGPTGDGRAKPDLVAPGERILSCAAGSTLAAIKKKFGPNARTIDYVEDSGTSMSAAHLSGVLAAFLSVRREYIGQPDRVKRIFTSTASDLGRVPQFQGYGLVDLMRAIQSV